jgi:hypothetical protein
MQQLPKDFFKDWANPTEEELRKWAYSDYYAPSEDFELMVTENPSLTLEFAADENCPSNTFFLSSLYTWVGDAVRGKFAITPQKDIEELLEKASMSTNDKIKKFVFNSVELIKNPELYEYDKWGLGGSLARE